MIQQYLQFAKQQNKLIELQVKHANATFQTLENTINSKKKP